jgi:hypothetical protein
MIEVCFMPSSSVSIVSRVRVGLDEFWFPAWQIDFSLFQNARTDCGAQPPVQCVKGKGTPNRPEDPEGVQVLSLDLGARRGGWSAPRPGRFLPPGKTRYPLYRRLGGPQGRSGRVSLACSGCYLPGSKGARVSNWRGSEWVEPYLCLHGTHRDNLTLTVTEFSTCMS